MERPPIAPLLVLLALGTAGAAALFLSGTVAADDGDTFRTPGPGYHDLEAVRALLDDWCNAGVPWVEPLDLGASRGGHFAPAIRFGAPGPVPLDRRPTVLLVGGLDGVSFAGGEAVLHTAHALLTAVAPRNDVAFVALPWAAPDGLVRAYGGIAFDGLNEGRWDADGDGRVAEDPPDDLDGDQRVLDMLVEDPAGPWTPSADARFLVPAREGDAPRYRWGREGVDDDGDGLFNEDGPGRVGLDANFPVGWQRCGAGGPLPLSEPLSRRLADLVLAERTVAVLCFQGNHGLLARPGGLTPGPCAPDLEADAPTYDRLARALGRHTGRPLERAPTLAEASGIDRPGSFLDWCAAVPGVLAVEIAPWGPGVASHRPRPTDGDGAPPPEPLRAGPAPGPRERAWARWLDEERGGMGFSTWHRVDVGPGHRALVGGWEPRTFHNPPEEILPEALAGLAPFVVEWTAALPRLELTVALAEREGDLVRLAVQVANRGALATSPALAGRWRGARGAGVTLTIDLPVGVELLAGRARTPLPPLPGGGVSGQIEWLLVAPEGCSLQITATSPGCATVTREVRP